MNTKFTNFSWTGRCAFKWHFSDNFSSQSLHSNSLFLSRTEATCVFYVTFLRKLFVTKFAFKLLILIFFMNFLQKLFFLQSLHSKGICSSWTQGYFFAKWALRKQSVSNVSGFKLVLSLVVNSPPAELAFLFSYYIFIFTSFNT